MRVIFFRGFSSMKDQAKKPLRQTLSDQYSYVLEKHPILTKVQ